MSKVNTGFEGRSRRSVWHHVIICLSYSIHVSLRTRSRDVRAECGNHMLRRKRSGGRKVVSRKMQKWANSLNFHEFVWISLSFQMTSSYYTHDTGTRNESFRLFLVLVDKWVHNHHQAWSACLFLFLFLGGGWFLVAFLCSYETPTMSCKSYIKGKGAERWKTKTKFAPISSKYQGKTPQ